MRNNEILNIMENLEIILAEKRLSIYPENTNQIILKNGENRALFPEKKIIRK